MQEMITPVKEKKPGLYKTFNNRWVASLIIAFFGVGLAWTGNYTVLWPAFSGANQLIASIVMLTVAVWVKKKLNPSYTMVVLIPAIILWVTVTAGIIWYEIAIIPTFFVATANAVAQTKNIITGVVVGAINIFMLVLNFIMISAFMKNWKTKQAD